jgi:chromosome segregation ATPase
MTETSIIKEQLETLQKAHRETQQQLITLERQQAQLAQQKEQAIQVLLHQQGAIQSAEEMLQKLQQALPVQPTPVDGVLVES